jgi:hypothetical protein
MVSEAATISGRDAPRSGVKFQWWWYSQPQTVRRGLAAILVLSCLLNIVGIRWGLPNGNRTWAADALQPLTPLAVGRHVLFGDHWNSGWFYFKYPVGHPMLVLAAQSPVLGWFWVRGEFRRLSSEYPHGFRNPERSLSVLALVSRLVTVVMATATVFLAFCSAALLVHGMAGLWSAVLLAGAYPFVFYSHTSNVDVPLLFWLALCCFAALWAARADSVRASAVAGVAAGMALLTKEQGIGFLAAVPMVWLLGSTGRQALNWRRVRSHAAAAGLSALLVTVLVANVPWNPSGYVNRWRFLAGSLPAEVREKYAPYQFLTQVPREFSWSKEWKKLARASEVTAHALYPIGAAGAVAGFVILVRFFPYFAVMLFVTAAAYYLASLRALELVQVRYTLPLVYLACLAAAGVGYAVQRWSKRFAGGALLAWAVLSFLPGAETVRLLVRDPRYAAERWFASHMPEAPVRVEVYQPMTYLPRFPSGWKVQRVSVAERTRELFLQRRPDLVVLSSGGRAGLTGAYRRDWKPGSSFFAESDAAREFLRALESGQLGYDLAGQFATWSWLDPRIPSLNPAIRVYRPRTAP